MSALKKACTESLGQALTKLSTEHRQVIDLVYYHEKSVEEVAQILEVHGEQEGRFFHGYYDCYCYLPLYVFCGRHLLLAKLRRSTLDAADGAVEEMARIVAQIRRRWPRVRILVRANSGFARDDLMAWCEANGVDFLFGLGRNERLVAEIAAELWGAARIIETPG